MAPPHSRKIKVIEFDIDGTQFECQVQTWNMANNTDDGERYYTQCPEGEFREEAEPDYALELTFFADWRSNGISDFLTAHDGEEVAFQLDHHPDIPGEHVQWSGFVKIKAPNAGGEARTTEMTEVTLPVKGKPEYARL
ncbi:hypothetical protein [Micromonospora aurantiaca (nom. illeg.)]|uniref:hypothetical protein n=1 Tax=Micromonospora aurantiaca (nom. illeg.) TaxID=47850 RepID=UPI003F4A2CEF